MSKTITITQNVAETTPAGSAPNVQSSPSVAQTYTTKAILESEIGAAGGDNVVLTPPALFAVFGAVLRIYSEEAGKDISKSFSVVIVTSGPQTLNLHPTPNADGSIQLTLPTRFGTTGTETLTSITVTNLDGAHADAAKVTLEAWA